jgi:tetratricopeptide (TPR) repeat protein
MGTNRDVRDTTDTNQGIVRKTSSRPQIAPCRFNALEAVLAAEDFQQVSPLAHDGLEKEVSLFADEDIDSARRPMVMGEIYLRLKRFDDALGCLQSALRRASRSGLTPELAVLHTLLGHLYLATKQYEAAYAESRKALDLAKTTMASIDSEDDRRLYQRQRFVRRLMEQVKTLGAILGSTSSVSR